MKVGFVVHFFDFRNDVRKVIELIGQRHEVVLFVRKADEEIIRQHAGNAEIRIVDEQRGGGFNRFWDTIFRFFGRLPKSRQNYYLMEYFKISLSENQTNRKRAYWFLDLGMKLPRFFSYDRYLNNIRYKGKTSIHDIEQFICFTDISDSYFFARLLRECKPVKVYVYSWDHPCKHFKYSRNVRYLVWHEGLKQDLIELQDIAPKQIKIVGASQFAYIHQHLSLPVAPKPFAFEYLYFGCAIGIPSLVVNEIQVVQLISESLTEMQSSLKLVVRPYPVLANWSYYENLKELPNIVLDDQFRSQNLSVSEDQIMEKYQKIHHAKAFIHLGTTMGLEACFTATPSLILDFPAFANTREVLSLRNFVHQYQNEKYLMHTDRPNVVRSVDELKIIIRQLESGSSDFTSYNMDVVRGITLKDFKQFAIDLTEA